MDYDVVSNSVEETIELGRKIGEQLKGGEVLGICGQLGSGKTHLIKGIASGCECGDCCEVNSPTYVIVNEYAGRLDVYHIDAYRLNSISEFEQIGFDDFCDQSSVILIEWADKIETALKGINYIRIEIFHTSQNKRKINIKNMSENIALYFKI